MGFVTGLKNRELEEIEENLDEIVVIRWGWCNCVSPERTYLIFMCYDDCHK